MRRSIVLGLLLALLAPVVPAASAAGEGVHPWDLPYRRITTHYRDSDRRPYARHWIDPLELSPWRSETHALHPYFRARYPFVFEPNPWIDCLTGCRDLRVSTVPPCDNYVVIRENYRTPPSRPRCLR
jgi:hypothetical protein